MEYRREFSIALRKGLGYEANVFLEQNITICSQDSCGSNSTNFFYIYPKKVMRIIFTIS